MASMRNFTPLLFPNEVEESDPPRVPQTAELERSLVALLLHVLLREGEEVDDDE
jgi:hypothetical protein